MHIPTLETIYLATCSLIYFFFIVIFILCFFFFFFSSRRRHTRCSRDWSSDVCSSDLYEARGAQHGMFYGSFPRAQNLFCNAGVWHLPCNEGLSSAPGREIVGTTMAPEIGRASCRERVEITVVEVSVKRKRISGGG